MELDPPFDEHNPDPEPFQLCNEVHRKDHTLAAFCRALEVLRKTDIKSYMAFVAALRAK